MKRLGRISPLILVVALLVGGALFTLMWYVQASQAKTAFTQALAQINQDRQLLTYQSIETTGFPTHINIRVIQPKFTGEPDKLLAALFPEQTTPTPGVEATETWLEEIFWAGNITFGSNILSDEFTIAVEGPVTQISTFGDDRTVMVSQPKGRSFCTIQVKQDGFFQSKLWNIAKWVETPATQLEELRYVECSIPGYTLLADATGEELASSGLLYVRAQQNELGEGPFIQFSLKVQDLQMRPAITPIIDRYRQHFASGYDLPFYSLNYAEYGKQNADVEFSLTLPPEGDEKAPYSLDLSQFYLSNDLFSTRTSLKVGQNHSRDTKTTSVKLDSESSATPAYDDHLREYLAVMIRQIKETEDETDLNQLKELFSGNSVEEAVNIIDPIIPKLNSLGTIKLFVDTTLKEQPEKKTTHLSIDGIEISTLPYGVSASGSSYLPPEAQNFYAPGADFTIKCHNCTLMLDEMTRYIQRVQTTLANLNKDYADTPSWVSPALAQSIKTFITSLALEEKATGKDNMLLFRIQSDKTGTLTLNNRTPEEVMQLYMAIVAPYLASTAENYEPVENKPE